MAKTYEETAVADPTVEHHDKAHPVGTSVGGAAGAATGAVIGTAVGGPGVGTLVGAAVGAVAGGLAGHGIAEGIDPTVEDAYWRDNYKSRPYVQSNSSYEDYQPAYRYGWESRGQYANRTWDQAENDLSKTPFPAIPTATDTESQSRLQGEGGSGLPIRLRLFYRAGALIGCRGREIDLHPSMALEPATPEDAPAIAALRAAVARHLTARHGQGHWSSEGTEKGVLYGMKTARVYLIRGAQGALAVLSLATKKPWAIDPAYFTACKRPLYLTDMAVDPSMQRQGIGRLCLEEARRIALDWPADAIRLDAYDAAAGAGGFYRRCGFREVGRVVYRKVPLIYFEHLVGD
jgi:GNAT superfamily N-acetyltransferase